jgi:hypothetical protein
MEEMTDEWEQLHARLEEEISKAKAGGKKGIYYRLVSESPREYRKNKKAIQETRNKDKVTFESLPKTT